MTAIYLDNNATTQPAPEVVEAMLPCLRAHFGNPSSLHEAGERAADAVGAARRSVARLLGASPGEIVFTSGGTEADATALEAVLRRRSRPRALVSAVEHAAVLEPLARLEREGLEVARVPVDGRGRLDVAALLARLDEDCALVSVMWANNETGVVNDVARIGAACRSSAVPFHVDAVQAVGKIALDLRRTPVDLLSLSAHKFHGPKGVGALYVRAGAPFAPLLLGGPQEGDRRAGTENVPGIAGLGRAAELALEWLAGEREPERLRDRLEQAIVERVPDVRVNGGGEPRVWNTASLCFEGLSGEALVMLLSAQGVCASTGSACASGRNAPSHVLLAMGLSPAEASSSVRFSLSRYTTEQEVEAAAERVVEGAAALRAMAP